MNINQIHIIGINYRKADISLRGRFSFSREHYEEICKQPLPASISEFFILSTCNRTEIYAVSARPHQVLQWLISKCPHFSDIQDELYSYSGIHAVEHALEVCCGLDSQLLGDYEITGQLKSAFKIAKDSGATGPILERLLNTALQCSKQVRSETNLTSGSVSVSFTAVQYLKQELRQLKQSRILIVGTGKMGRNTCKNLLDYAGAENISLINRTEETVAEFAKQNKLKYLPWNKLAQSVDEADIIIVATNAASPVILTDMIAPGKRKTLIDLSVPANICPSLALQDGISYMNVDSISRINDETLLKRKSAVPAAKAIVESHVVSFDIWIIQRQKAPALKAARLRMESMHECPLFIQSDAFIASPQPKAIQQAVNHMAVSIKMESMTGCLFIHAINEYISLIAS
jgi:glutamyl-tRNA reductase